MVRADSTGQCTTATATPTSRARPTVSRHADARVGVRTSGSAFFVGASRGSWAAVSTRRDTHRLYNRRPIEPEAHSTRRDQRAERWAMPTLPNSAKQRAQKEAGRREGPPAGDDNGVENDRIRRLWPEERVGLRL